MTKARLTETSDHGLEVTETARGMDEPLREQLTSLLRDTSDFVLTTDTDNKLRSVYKVAAEVSAIALEKATQ